ncbi:unnamed protein product [Rhodiola kirilowii]
MSKLSSLSNEGSVSSSNIRHDQSTNQSIIYSHIAPSIQQPAAAKKKRNLPGNPDPDAEVIALSPKTLMATNRFVCEICSKGFQRDQNLQLHRRGHNLPWKLKQRSSKEIKKKVYVCPEVSCVHHDPARALGDLTGIKKHFCRKHGEKKWKCDKCSKKYAVQSDWKAHSKICGTREYRCDCGTLFSRRDSFITHRAFCDALAEEGARGRATTTNPPIICSVHQLPTSDNNLLSHHINPNYVFAPDHQIHPAFSTHQTMKKEQLQQHGNGFPPWLPPYPPPQAHFGISPSSPIFSINQGFTGGQAHQELMTKENPSSNPNPNNMGPTLPHYPNPPPIMSSSSHMSATALLQKAAQMGTTMSKTGLSQPAASMISSRSGTHNQTHVSADNSFGLNLSSSHDVTVNSSTGFLTSFGFDHHHHSYEDVFGEMLNQDNNKQNDPPNTRSGVADDDHGTSKLSAGGGNGHGLTRDFLGLKDLSHSDILSIAGDLSDCMNNTGTVAAAASQSPLHQSPNQQQVWQG